MTHLTFSTQHLATIILGCSLLLSNIQSTEASELRLVPPLGLQAGWSESGKTAVLVDPQRVHDRKAPVIQFQLLETPGARIPPIMGDLLRAAGIPDHTPADILVLEPMPTKNGTSMQLTLYRWLDPYRAQVQGIMQLPHGFLFVSLIAHSPEDYRLYAEALRRLLLTTEIK